MAPLFSRLPARLIGSISTPGRIISGEGDQGFHRPVMEKLKVYVLYFFFVIYMKRGFFSEIILVFSVSVSAVAFFSDCDGGRNISGVVHLFPQARSESLSACCAPFPAPGES